LTDIVVIGREALPHFSSGNSDGRVRIRVILGQPVEDLHSN
jgi:hypothetical protein